MRQNVKRSRPSILQVLPELGSGGVERGVVEVSAALVAKGYAAYVASAGGAMVSKLERLGGQHLTLPAASKNPLTMWWNMHRLCHLIHKYKIDLVHARSRAPAWSAYYAAKKMNIPFVTTFHGVYNGATIPLKHRYNSVMVRGQRVIAVSNHVRDHILRYYPQVEAERLTVIHRGADIEEFDPAKANGPTVMKLCKDWHVPEGMPVILMPGRITRWKGQHVVLEALAKLSHRNFFCIFLGEPGKHPAYLRELEEYVARHGLEGHVRFVGATAKMRDAYHLADLVVCPSIEPEAFGRVPVEAQAMGKPVISSAHGGAMETIIDGATGWLVPPADADALLVAIERALHMPALQKEQWQKVSRQHAVQQFSTQAMCQKVLAVYEDILS